MKIKIDLKMDTKVFWLMIIIAILLIYFISLIWNISLLEVHTYTNCSCPEHNYWNYNKLEPNEAIITHSLHWLDNNPMGDLIRRCCYPLDCPQAKDNPEDCKCTYMVMCGTAEELGI